MNPQKEVSDIFGQMEERLASAPTYDLETLLRVHEYWEFEAVDDLTFDAWMHAHIKKATAIRNQSGEIAPLVED